MKQLVFVLPLGWDASPLQSYPPLLIYWYPFIHLVGRDTVVREKCLAQEHKTLIRQSPARA